MSDAYGPKEAGDFYDLCVVLMWDRLTVKQ